MGIFYGFGHGNHYDQVHRICFTKLNQLKQLFLVFEKKKIFHVSDSTFLIKSSKVGKTGF